MPLSVVTAPPLLSPCRNAVWVEYGCNSYRQGTAPNNAGFLIERLFTPPVGHTITITLPSGEKAVFRAVAGPPDDSGEQYTIGSLVALANAMNSHVAFSALYVAVVTSSSPQIWISGRWPWVMIPSAVNSEGGDAYAFASIQPNADYIYAENYSVRSTVWVEREWMTDKWEPLPTGEHFPGADLRTRENVAQLLLPSLGYDWPAYGLATPMRTLAPIRRYRVQAWERYGTPPTDHVAQSTANAYAWYAGQRHRDTPTQLYWATTLYNTSHPSPWLTYRGREGKQEVGANQQHVLGWLRNRTRLAGITMRLAITIAYTDGTTATTYGATDSSIAWEKGEIALFPCGFDTLGLASLQPLKTAYKYTVQLVEQSGGVASAVAEPHTFWLATPDHSELHLEYINSFGVVESLRCTGSWEQGLAIKYQDIMRGREMVGGVMPPAATSDARQLLVSATNTLQISTGFRDEAEHNAQCDIFFSPEVRLVDHIGRRHLPVLIADGSHAVSRRGADEEENLYALNMQLTVGDAEQAWGDRVTMPLTTVPGEEAGGETPGTL